VKVAISAAGPSLAAAVDPRFGRCPWFVLAETADRSFEAVENGAGELGGGAGLQAAQQVVRRGARAVLTGNCGPNAHKALGAAGVEVFTGCDGTVAEVVERFAAGQLRAAAAPSVPGHAGLPGGGR
jgi:predicted Fe-Mo cluster-binding NifX family protein